MKEELARLFRQYTGSEPDHISSIPRSVSTRKYFRIEGDGRSVIGTYSPDIRETKAFSHFSRHFTDLGIRVPRVYIESHDKKYYLQEDLGNTTLFDLAESLKNSGDSNILNLYRNAIDEVIRLQLKGDRVVDYSLCVPRPEFDKQSVLWDLNHFKYYFLKLSGISYDEQLLENEFDMIAGEITEIKLKGFMFRDFQSRNIMIRDGMAWFIDFQGGRRGPLQYDLASLVFEAKAGLSEEERTELIEYYLGSLRQHTAVNQEDFYRDFYLAALVRVLQVLGAYGLRGIVEKKAVFLQSIPNGLSNLSFILEHLDQAYNENYLTRLLHELTLIGEKFRKLPAPFEGLTVTISSFSYRGQLPDDITGNGGGFVFDCRLLDNPGAHEKFRELNGMDREVVQFMEQKNGVGQFVSNVKEQLDQAIEVYQKRGYKDLMVNFGCTGGQHRSVYVSHKIADWIRCMKNVRVIEIHRELGMEK